MEDADGIPQNYTPASIPLPPDSQQADDFFAELDEIETDPLTLMFAQGLSGSGKEKKTMNPFEGLNSANKYVASDMTGKLRQQIDLKRRKRSRTTLD
ncbi:hypothetical protein V6N11_029891 [Hibiscus sabdariffa]|uniref:Uncharacterized protein n=1 Tax=Hibiscus sabdariffa TaxID=183260 RepID=A0ABR2PJL2_9ROSI